LQLLIFAIIQVGFPYIFNRAEKTNQHAGRQVGAKERKDFAVEIENKIS